MPQVITHTSWLSRVWQVLLVLLAVAVAGQLLAPLLPWLILIAVAIAIYSLTRGRRRY